MIDIPGAVYHTGHVVRDVHSAMQHWAGLAGAGPFALFRDFEFVSARYRGQPTSLRAHLAFAYSGESCIELIEPLGDQPGIYAELSGSFHHVGIGVPDLAASLATYAAAGVADAFRASFAFGGGCAYLDTVDSLGCFVELVEQTALVEQMLAQMRAAHRQWNRRDLTFKLG